MPPAELLLVGKLKAVASGAPSKGKERKKGEVHHREEETKVQITYLPASSGLLCCDDEHLPTPFASVASQNAT